MEVIREREREVRGGDCGSTVGSTDPSSTSGSETAVSVLDTGHTYSRTQSLIPCHSQSQRKSLSVHFKCGVHSLI